VNWSYSLKENRSPEEIPMQVEDFLAARKVILVQEDQ
jgi:hypothetical protein